MRKGGLANKNIARRIELENRPVSHFEADRGTGKQAVAHVEDADYIDPEAAGC